MVYKGKDRRFTDTLINRMMEFKKTLIKTKPIDVGDSFTNSRIPVGKD